MLKISHSDLAAIHRHLAAVYPEEGCGLLLGSRSQDSTIVSLVIPTKNIWNRREAANPEKHHSKRDRYEIDPRDLLEAMKFARSQETEIIGIYHSHPDHPARPSESDRSLAWPQYIYMICSVEQGTVTHTTAWELDDREQFQACIMAEF